MFDWSEVHYVSLLFIIPFVVLLPLYIRAENQGGFKKPTLLKLLLSGLCVVCALAGYVFWGMTLEASRILIVIALVFGFFGDYFLQFIQINEKKYIAGLVFFSLTQLSLIVFLSIQYGLAWPECAITILVAVGALLLIKQQKWELGKSGVPLVIYLLLLVFMASKAVLALFGGGQITLSMGLFATGAVLFVVSDLLTGINNYSSGKIVLGSVHLVTYFCGILLIALSVYG